MMRGLSNGTDNWVCILCLLSAFVIAIFAKAHCDKTKCKGTIKMYEELKCKPVHAKKGDCCASRYDCSHLYKRPKNKCYANGHAYSIGEQLTEKDRSSPCDKCTCGESYQVDIAAFNCAIVDCPFSQVKPGCYRRNDLYSCCEYEEICPEKEEDRVKCEVDGRTYLDGQYFNPESDPDVSCLCREGYEGKNVEPFCKRYRCPTELRHSVEIAQNCAPVFYAEQSPRTNCNAVSYRCQNSNDTVLHTAGKKSSKNVPDEMKCKFGNMKLLVGEELNQATDYSSVCVRCVCEVPPFPTCQRLPDDECDITKHPPFSQYEY